MKYGVPYKINGKKNPEYWRAYNKTEKAAEAAKRYRKKNPKRRKSRCEMKSKRWLKSVERYYTRGNDPVGDVIREVTTDDIRSLL